MGVGSAGRTSARIVVALAIAVGLSLPANASAAQTIGQAAPADGCTGGEAYTQGPLLASTYSPSAPGVITSWSSFAGPVANTQLELLVLDPTGAGPTHFRATQKDQARTLTQANALNTFSGLHLPIAPRQQLGLFLPSGEADCFILAPPDNGLFFTGGDPPLGTDVDFTGSNSNRRLNASAVVEPDADGDGFGDQTQDACPAAPGVQSGCPDSTRKKRKCKRKKANQRAANSAKKKRCKKKRR
jgi:hypothetical protein